MVSDANMHLHATEANKLTIICPVYNEEVVIPLFFERMAPVMEQLECNFNYQVILVFTDNCSSDGTLAAIRTIAEADSRVYYISLAKNVGYQRSLHCALSNCAFPSPTFPSWTFPSAVSPSGFVPNLQRDLFAFIDVDCEDPPEMIIEFVQMHKQGYDVVYGERVDREEPQSIQNIRKFFYRLTKLVADDEIILDMAEFCLMTNEVRTAVLQEKTSFPFIRASIGRVGFRRIGIPYKRHKRIAGQTHYNFMGMTVFAITGILSSTTLPLRLPMYTLPFWILSLAILCTWYGASASSWALAAILFLTICYLGTTTAFIAIYVARSYRNALSHPNSIIRPKFSRLPFSTSQLNPSELVSSSSIPLKNAV